MNNYMKPIVSSLKQWVAEYIKNYPSEVEALDEVPEGATVLAEVGGQIKRVPAVTGEGSGTGGPVLLADSSGAKWRLTVGTDGTLSTEAVTE